MGPCEICQEASSQRCSQCKCAYYCSKDHQKSHWKHHKKTCASKANGDHEGSSNFSIPSVFGLGSWFDSISPTDHYEWLTNCYMLRCDDDYAFGGCYLHGPYNPDADVNSITEDFLCFCLLAKRNKVIPQNWNWAAFLKAAGKWAGFAFEKSDATERWGPMAGMALRIAAERVYGCSAYDGESECQNLALQHAEAPINTNQYVAEVGGKNAWNAFKSSLRSTRGM